MHDSLLLKCNQYHIHYIIRIIINMEDCNSTYLQKGIVYIFHSLLKELTQLPLMHLTRKIHALHFKYPGNTNSFLPKQIFQFKYNCLLKKKCGIKTYFQHIPTLLHILQLLLCKRLWISFGVHMHLFKCRCHKQISHNKRFRLEK